MRIMIIKLFRHQFSLRLLKNRRILRSMATCFGIILGQHLCGVNMMIFYALMLFETTGSGELTGSEQTLVVGAVQILVCLLAAFLVDVLGRRILLTVSSLFMGLFLILLGKPFYQINVATANFSDQAFLAFLFYLFRINFLIRNNVFHSFPAR